MPQISISISSLLIGSWWPRVPVPGPLASNTTPSADASTNLHSAAPASTRTTATASNWGNCLLYIWLSEIIPP